MEPRFNEPLFNEVLDITNDTLHPGQSYSKMYGLEPRYNEPRYNEYNELQRQPASELINAEQINSQQES